MLFISTESRAFGSAGKKISYLNVVMCRNDYFFLAIEFIATFATGSWIIGDKTLDWSRTMTFSPGLSLSSVISAALVFATLVLICAIRVLKAQ